MTKREVLRLAVLFSALHLGLSMGTFVAAFSLAMGRFDSRQDEAGFTESILTWLSDVLLWPFFNLYRVLFDSGAAPLTEWAFIIWNSITWGLAITLVVAGIRWVSTTKKPADQTDE